MTPSVYITYNKININLVHIMMVENRNKNN